MESSDGESVVTTIGEKLAPFNPSDPKVVETAIRLLEIQEGDVVYDLGCGDGRFLIAVSMSEFTQGTTFEQRNRLVR